MSFFTGCEEEPQQLSDFIIGEWSSDTMDDFDMSADFNGVTYNLVISAGDTSLTFPLSPYSINNVENQLTHIEPDFDGDGDVEEVIFDVGWIEGENTMIWYNTVENDNIIEWSRID